MTLTLREAARYRHLIEQAVMRSVRETIATYGDQEWAQEDDDPEREVVIRVSVEKRQIRWQSVASEIRQQEAAER